MKVRKRDGRLEDANYEKIQKSIQRVCEDLHDVDYHRIAVRTIGGLFDGVTTKELDELSIRTAVGFIEDDPIYSKVAARLLVNYIGKEVTNQDIHSFSQSIQIGYDVGLINAQTYDLVMKHKRKLNSSINDDHNKLFEFYGVRVIYDRYLLKHPEKRLVFETPQYFLMRVACGLAEDASDAIELYNLLSSLDYMTSTPTLFNSGTQHSQMSSCYLLASPEDDLHDIYKRYSDVAQLSKWAGGIGLSYSKIRSNGSLIKGTNGKSDGIIPWLHTLSASVAAVTQGGKRKGAAAVYLDTHHPDIMEFLELKDNTGDVEKRAHNLNLANWIPDLFMKRVEEDGIWSLFDPTIAPELNSLFGEEYEKRYLELESEGKFAKQIQARKVYARMMRTLSETGNGWMCFKDSSNLKSNCTKNAYIASSNLCVEILEPTSKDETAVCNLGSINVANFVKDDKLDKNKLKKVVQTAIKYLDRVIDRNFYPIPEAAKSNNKWRPIGLGIMGLQDLFFKLRLPFESEEAIKLSAELQEEIYYWALKTSCELAKEFGKFPEFENSRTLDGILQFDLWNTSPNNRKRWDDLKEEIKQNGIRNSLLIAIAPTVTISAIAGTSECIEPQKANMFKYETLSGDFVSINKYLIHELKQLGMWNEKVKNEIKSNRGSIQNVPGLPEWMYQVYKTVWEISQKKLIDHAVARAPYIDQSQSLNLFIETPTIEKLSSAYFYVWKSGLKTTYYLRSRAATTIHKVSIEDKVEQISQKVEDEVCESCT